MKQHNTTRDSYFDFLRGVAIIFVVGIHTPGNALSFDSFSGEMSIVIRQIIGCAVPIFLAISGFFLGKKLISSKSDYFSFLRRQIPKIYIPYLVFALPHLLLTIKSGGGAITSLVNYLVCNLSVYYFVALIVQLYVLSPIMNKISKVGLAVWFIISTLACCFITFYMQVEGNHLPLLVYAGFFPTLIVYFAQGMYLAQNRVASAKTWVIIALIGLLLNYIESYFLHQFNGGGFGLKPSTYIYSFALIMVLFSDQAQALYKQFQNEITRIIVGIGRISYVLYLAHMMILIVFYKLMKIMPEWMNCWSVKWIGTLVMSCIFIIMLRKFIPEKYHRYLGLY